MGWVLVKMIPRECDLRVTQMQALYWVMGCRQGLRPRMEADTGPDYSARWQLQQSHPGSHPPMATKKALRVMV